MASKYGHFAACRHCNQDIEFNGRLFGWRDRGGNRACVPFISRAGEIIKPKTKHAPFNHFYRVESDSRFASCV